MHYHIEKNIRKENYSLEGGFWVPFNVKNPYYPTLIRTLTVGGNFLGFLDVLGGVEKKAAIQRGAKKYVLLYYTLFR